MIATVNPIDNTLLKRFPQHPWRKIETMLNKAESGGNINRTSVFAVRSRRLHVLADLLETRQAECAALITLEMGKPIGEALAEVQKCVKVCRYYADHARHFLPDEPVHTEWSQSFVTYLPLGTILAIMPWNFPFWQVFRFAAAALMAGNAVLLKHAPNVPQCALAIERLFIDANFPEGIFQNVFIENEKVQWLIADPRTHAITFTGSPTTGAKVAEMAGKHLKKTVMELGGSDPFIVLDDAVLKDAAMCGVQSRMTNCGQSCIAAKRFIVTEAIAADFTRLMTNHIKQLKIGNPNEPETQIGPLARPDLLQNIERQVRESVQKGAQIVTGGSKVLGTKGNFYHPTLLINAAKGMPIFEEEVFGPVASIAVVKNANDAIALANDTLYGLGASIWTSDTDRALRFARQLQSGVAAVNTLVQSDPRLPFGGLKRSGYGRELSEHGIREFVNIKTIILK